ncbi:MAG TPA: nicotinate-nucleotide adenylyltransferase [Candidatus Limnocylindrales bacterium]|nr:nicotinate-nucleotide adenylyltransferase [Candidatus Limnocylindrales bacterium]
MINNEKEFSQLFFKRNNNKAGYSNIGLMGGTFDPIHVGHLVTAEEARQQFDLDCVVFVPAGAPPHKEKVTISLPEHRYLMTTLAVMSNPFFYVSEVEINRETPSYTIDTVKHFSCGGHPSPSLFFITGADAILEIFTWKDYEELFRLSTFIAVSRPGYSLDRFRETLSRICPEMLHRVHLLEIPALAVSSTFIRERVILGKTIKYLTPEPVEQYIKKHGLYVTGP